MTLEVICKSFDELNNHQLYACLKLRSDVFVVEQNCVYPDLDNKDIDANTLHVFAYIDKEIAAYARILPEGLSYQEVSIGRVLVAAKQRGKGFAKQLMEKTITIAKAHFPNQAIQIGAQLHLTDFYQSFRFKVNGEPYDEDGIMHIDMLLPATQSTLL